MAEQGALAEQLPSPARLECQLSQGVELCCSVLQLEEGVVLSLGASVINRGSKTGSCFKNKPRNGRQVCLAMSWQMNIPGEVGSAVLLHSQCSNHQAVVYKLH